MRYTCPEECAGVSHAGTILTREKDGTIEAPADHAAALAPHGIVPLPAPAASARRRTDDRRLLR